MRTAVALTLIGAMLVGFYWYLMRRVIAAEATSDDEDDADRPDVLRIAHRERKHRARVLRKVNNDIERERATS